MANPTESCTPYRHQVEPTQLLTVRSDFAYACPLSKPASMSILPDFRQLVDRRAEQIDPLAAGDLGVQVVLLGDDAQGDQLVGGDLAARHTRHHGVGAAALDVGEEAVVGVLDRGPLDDALVPQARQDRGDGGLAGLAAVAPAVARESPPRTS